MNFYCHRESQVFKAVLIGQRINPLVLKLFANNSELLMLERLKFIYYVCTCHGLNRVKFRLFFKCSILNYVICFTSLNSELNASTPQFSTPVKKLHCSNLDEYFNTSLPQKF